MKKIKLTIQEIVKDFYSMAERDGYLSGLAEGFELSDSDKIEYHSYMKELMNKYLPNWKEKITDEYFNQNKSEEEKGLILSIELYENFKEIFYQLV